MTRISRSGCFNVGNRKLNKTNLAVVFCHILRTQVQVKSPASLWMSPRCLTYNARMKMMGSVSLATNLFKKDLGSRRKEGNLDESKDHRYNEKWGLS